VLGLHAHRCQSEGARAHQRDRQHEALRRGISLPHGIPRIHNVYSDYVLGSFCDWDPITAGIVESDLPVDRDHAPDTELLPRIEDYILQKKPNFLFIQMDSVDGAGHKNGYGSRAHLERIGVIDGYIDRIYRAVQKAGIADDTLFAVIADHGGTYSGEGQPAGHGGWTDGEKLVTFALAGKTVQQGEMGDANVRDLAAIILYALDVPSPDFAAEGWTSQIPSGVFADPTLPAYRDISSETGAEMRRSMVQHTSEKV